MQAVQSSTTPAHYDLDHAPSYAGSAALPPELQMLLAMANSQSAQTGAARQSIEQAYEQLEALRAQIAEAIERAREAEDDAGFWGDVSGLFGGDIAAIAGFVASAALIAGSAGTGAAVLAGVALACSVSGKVAEELELAPELVIALQVAAGVSGAFAGQLGEVHGVWKAIATGATVTQAGATAVGGGAHIAAGQYQADAIEERAQAEYHRGEEDLAFQDIDAFLDAIEEAAKNTRFTTRSASEALSQRHAAESAVIARIGA